MSTKDLTRLGVDSGEESSSYCCCGGGKSVPKVLLLTIFSSSQFQEAFSSNATSRLVMSLFVVKL